MLANYNITNLIYPNGEFHLVKAVLVINEGFFYKIDRSHILEKYEILDIAKDNKMISVIINDKDITLILERIVPGVVDKNLLKER